MKKDLVVILKGGKSEEREISLKSGHSIETALKALNFNYVTLDPKESNWIEKIKLYNEKYNIISFNALHGGEGENGKIPSILEVLNIKYTHSGPLASSIFMHKPTSKLIFNALNIPTPEYKIVSKNDISSTKKILPYNTLVLKPTSEGSSLNVYILDNSNYDFFKHNYPFEKSEIMAEQYIQGQEFSVAILLGKEIGTIGINSKNKFYDYEAKYKQNLTEFDIPAKIPSHVENLALKYTLLLYNKFQCISTIRTDFIYNNKDDKLFLLEVNTHPGFTNSSLVPKLAKKCCNIEFEELIKMIIKDATQDL